MAEGRNQALEAAIRDSWTRSSQLVCLLANVYRDPAQRRTPYEPHEFNPFGKPPRPRDVQDPADKVKLKDVLHLFLGKASKPVNPGRPGSPGP